MLESAARLFDSTDFTPRANCGAGWNPGLIWLHVSSDLFIWLAYVSIPLVLLYFVRRRDVPFPKLFVLFALFILFCGFGHFLDALMFQYPLYRLAGVWKGATAAVSWVTVMAMVLTAPRVAAAISAFGRPPTPPPRSTTDTALHRLALPPGRTHANDYIVGVLAAVLALLVRAAIDPLVTTDHFYLLSLLAVVFVSWHSGFGPALVTLVLSLVGMAYFFVAPLRSFGVAQFSNQLATAVFFFSGVFCAALGEAQRRARLASKEALAVALEQKDALTAEVARRREVEEALRESEGRFRSMADGAPAMVWLAERDQQRTYFNRTWLEFTGRRVEDELGGGWADDIHPDDRDRYLQEYTTAFAARRPFEVEYRLRRNDGVYRWVLARGNPRFTPSGAFAGFVGLCLDVTDRKQAQDRLREITRRIGAILDSITDAAFGLDTEFRYTYANRHWETMFGLRATAVVGRSIWEVFPKLVGTAIEDGYRRAMRERVPVTVELVHPSTDRWVEFRAYPAPDGGLGVYLRDIEDKKSAERERRQLLSLVEASTDLIGLAELDGRITYFNDAGLRLLGIDSLAEARGKTLFDFVVPEDLSTLRAELMPALQAGGRWEGEWRYRNAKTGRPVPVSKKVSLIRDPGTGEPTAYATVSRDITAQKRAEAQIREEARINETLNRVGTTLAAELELDRILQTVTDQATQVTEARFGAFFYNATDDRGDRYSLFTLSGAPRAAFEGFPMPRSTAVFAPTFQGAGPVRLDDVTADPRYGQNAPYHGMPAGHLPVRSYLAVPVVSRSGEVIGGLFFGHEDVGVFTGRHEQLVVAIAAQAAIAIDNARLVEALREREAQFRTLAEAVPQIVWVTRPDGYHEYYNPRWYEFTGLTEEESVGFGWSTPLHPDDKARAEARWKQSTDTGEEYEIEYRFRGRDGGYRWFLGRALPQRDATGTVVRWFGTCTDIHDAKLAADALRTSEQRFRQLADSMPQIVFAARPDGHVDYFNRRWYEYTGFPADGRTGDESWVAVHEPDSLPRVAEVWGRSLRTGEPYQIEYRLRRADGAFRWHLGRALPVRDDSGAIVRWYGTNTDIHDAKLAAEALRTSEERYRTLTEAIPQIVWNTDPDGEATYFNRRWLDFTGLSPDESRGHGWLAALHPDDRDRVFTAWWETVGHVAPGGSDRFAIEVRVRQHSDEGYRWFLTVAVPLRRPDGSIDQWIGSMADIHDQKTAARLVEEANLFLEATINALPSHIAVLDQTGVILKVNDAWRRFGDQNGLRMELHGVGSNYLDACDVVCTIDPELRLSDGIRAVIRGERDAYRTEYPCHSPSDRRWFQMRITRFPGDGPVRVVVAHENITDRVLAELAVRESEEKFRTMAESIPQLAWMMDAEGYIFWYNQRWFDYTGTTLDEMKGWGWQSVHDPAELPRVVAKFKAHIASGEPWEDTFPLRRHDGEYRWHLSRARPIRDEHGKILRWFGTNTDVTEQRQLEQALRAAAERFRTLTEAVPQMVWTADPKGEVTFFNRRWDEFTGLPLEKGRVEGWGEVIHPEDAEELRAGWQSAVARRPDLFTHEFRLRRADGAYRWMLSTAVPLRDAAGGVAEWVGSITDIDDQRRYAETLEQTVQERTAALVAEVEERTRAEAEVRKQREFLDAILANVADGIVACDPDGALTLFNRAALEFHGLPLEPLPPAEWAGRYDLFRSDAETPMPTEEIPLYRALRGERVRDAEMVIAPRGKEARFLLAYGQPLTDADGRKLGAVVSMRDVTELREADRQLAEAAAGLRRANTELARSNGELEQFAYVASHDLQEPLRKIQAFGDRLTTKYREQLPDGGREYVDRMLVSAGRMRRLIDDLLSFSRVTTQARPFTPQNLGKLVGEVVNDLSDRIEQVGGEVRVGELPSIDADPTQLRQLFQNLISNALKFHHPGVPPVVEVSAESGTRPGGADGEPVRVCRITVRDNGIGFDEKYRDRIFQVFQRLHGKEEYEGTGVGLAICRKIADRHGGTITAHGRPGEGAAFVVTLPVHHANPPDGSPSGSGG